MNVANVLSDLGSPGLHHFASTEVAQFLCLEDNYGFLVRDKASGMVACIDTPDPERITRELNRRGWQLSFILNTHWHEDHIGGNERLRSNTGAQVFAPAEVARKTHVDGVIEGVAIVTLGDTRFQAIDTGGHTRMHTSYYVANDGLVFVGDALFTLGCGRLSEGDAEQMWSGLQRLAALPHETLVYSAHEYAAANARFALSVDDSPILAARANAIFQCREHGIATVPTTIGMEKATNPFLRAPLLRSVEGSLAFAQLRREKDGFCG